MAHDLGKKPSWQQSALPIANELGDTIDAWRRNELAAAHSKRTIQGRIYLIRRLARCGIDPLTATRDELVDWLSGLTNPRTHEPVSRSTLATYQSYLRAFYGWLEDTGRRGDDPSLKLPTPHAPRGVPRPLSITQVRALLEACTDFRTQQTRAYVTLACYAGLRAHEIAKIRGEDICGDQLRVRGKGGKDATIGVHPKVALLALGMPNAGWWFPSNGIEGHVNRCSVSSAVKRAMVRADVPGTPHACRHFYGTQVLRATGNLRLAQRALRHESPATTAIYTKVFDDELLSAIAAIPA